MVKVHPIVYQLKNQRGLVYTNQFQGNCEMINNGMCFLGEITEILLEWDICRINSYHFAED